MFLLLPLIDDKTQTHWMVWLQSIS